MLTEPITLPLPPPPPLPQVVTGRWLVDGNPQIILFDVGSASWKINEMKDELWNLAGVGIPNPDVECNDAVVFGYMVVEFLQQVRTETGREGSVSRKV